MPGPTLTCPEGPSDTGAFQLSWAGAGQGASFRLEEDGEVLYEGAEQATTVSGRRPGEYRYRVGELSEGEAPSWSEACVVTVSPPPLAAAFGLFGLGMVVFAAVLVVILRGHRQHLRGELR